jgi:hypothetical protein
MGVMAGTSLPWHMAFSLMAEMEVSADGCGQGSGDVTDLTGPDGTRGGSCHAVAFD